MENNASNTDQRLGEMFRLTTDRIFNSTQIYFYRNLWREKQLSFCVLFFPLFLLYWVLLSVFTRAVCLGQCPARLCPDSALALALKLQESRGMALPAGASWALARVPGLPASGAPVSPALHLLFRKGLLNGD